MKVLVACEESQVVCTAFRERGHEAYSCDIVECSGGHPEWHIRQDVIPLLSGGVRFATADGMEHSIDGRWDLIVAHPPCTYLSNAGASRLYRVIDGETYIRRDRFEKGWLGREFFLRLLDCDCDRVCIENPTPSKCFHLPECTQVIEPYQFGHPYTKRTCLWLRGLPPLKPTSIVHPIGSWVQGNGEAWKKKKARGEIVTGGHKDPRIRAKTFPGIGLAMAEQ